MKPFANSVIATALDWLLLFLAALGCACLFIINSVPVLTSTLAGIAVVIVIKDIKRQVED